MNQNSSGLDVVVVADGPRISLGAALNIVVSKKAASNVRFHIAIPKGSGAGSDVAEDVFRNFADSVFTIPDPSIVVGKKLYRIENKINALAEFGARPAVLADSDLVFLRPLPADYLIRHVSTAVPEHSKKQFPWERMYALLALEMPSIRVVHGSADTGPPWLNAGFVSTPNAEQLGRVWRMMCGLVMQLDWIPDQWPYLDQIALPLAIAQLSPHRTVSHDSILPAVFNQNIFGWAGDQSFVRSGFVIHHHNRIQLLQTYIEKILKWVRDGYPVVEKIMVELTKFEKDEIAPPTAS